MDTTVCSGVSTATEKMTKAEKERIAKLVAKHGLGQVLRFLAELSSGEPETPPETVPATRKRSTKPRPANPMWDAVVRVFGLSIATKTQKGRVGRLARELEGKNANPQLLYDVVEAYKREWPTAICTPEAVEKHFEYFANKLQETAPVPADSVEAIFERFGVHADNHLLMLGKSVTPADLLGALEQERDVRKLCATLNAIAFDTAATRSEESGGDERPSTVQPGRGTKPSRLPPPPPGIHPAGEVANNGGHVHRPRPSSGVQPVPPPPC